MSERVSLNKKVDVEIDFNIDYVACDGCGEDLGFKVNVDNHGDVQINVNPHECEGL